uniref:Uncharacterized protein n=1 Tax=Oryza sativa subsp. japonica TaxID=39947 RepID=Q2QVW1_ORYSJ|nr:hypothetical protein LOC_Os12g11450 [Oryza sativa Japonica Group]
MASMSASACASRLGLTCVAASAVEAVASCDEAAWGTSSWLVERISALIWSALAAVAAFAASTVFGTSPDEVARAEGGGCGAGAEADGAPPVSTMAPKARLPLRRPSPLLLHSPFALQPSPSRPSSVPFTLSGFARRSPTSAPAIVEMTTAYVEGRGYSTVVGKQ